MTASPPVTLDLGGFSSRFASTFSTVLASWGDLSFVAEINWDYGVQFGDLGYEIANEYGGFDFVVYG